MTGFAGFFSWRSFFLPSARPPLLGSSAGGAPAPVTSSFSKSSKPPGNVGAGASGACLRENTRPSFDRSPPPPRPFAAGCAGGGAPAGTPARNAPDCGGA